MAAPRYVSSSRRNSLGRVFEYLAIDLRRAYRKVKNRFITVDKKLIVFESFAGRSYSCSPRAIYEVLQKDSRFAEYRFVWVFRDPAKYTGLKNDRTRLVRFGSDAYYDTFARAGTWFVNSMIPLDIPKRANQTMVQCFHGTPFKRLRSDIVKNTENAVDSYDDMIRKNRIDTARYDYFLTPSRFTSEKFTSSFRLEEMGKSGIITELGYPRNDRLKRFTAADSDAIKQRLGLPGDKQVILYAPTWRDDQFSDEKGFVYKPPVDFEHLKRALGDRYIILYRAHYLIANGFDFSAHEGFVYDVSNVDDVNDLYIASDVLVTDYSSVFFDFANLQRPILYYMYDKEHYGKDLRGFYLPFDELAGEIVTTEDQLIAQLQDLERYTKRNRQRLREFSDRFNYLDDGHAAERVIDRVFLANRVISRSR